MVSMISPNGGRGTRLTRPVFTSYFFIIVRIRFPSSPLLAQTLHSHCRISCFGFMRCFLFASVGKQGGLALQRSK